jgi:hypothetical protein
MAISAVTLRAVWGSLLLESAPPTDPKAAIAISVELLTPEVAAQIELIPIDYPYVVTNPALLHLVQLLQTELQTPQPMSQMFISSIVAVLTAHLLQTHLNGEPLPEPGHQD